MRRFLNRKNILALKLLGLFLIILVLVYLAVNSPALYQKLKYKTEKIDLGQTDSLTLSEEHIPEGDRLVIPKINIDVPVVFLESLEEKDIMKGLENGVIHWPDTALPGEEGNCVITGHSSDFFWRKGGYKTVFALLDEFKEENEIVIYFNQQEFIYKVKSKNTVLANNLDILSQNKKEPTLTLYTCWPLGTDLRRLVVRAELE